MKFFVRSYTQVRDKRPNSDYGSNEIIVLTSDNWDDHGFETTFHVDLFRGEIHKELGKMKILNKEKKRTSSIIPDAFIELSNEFISLGSSKDFYDLLVDCLGKNKSFNVLKSLNDISVVDIENNPNFSIDDPGIQNSFFRSSNGRYLYEEVKNIYFDKIGTSDRDYKFSFMANLRNDDKQAIEIDFEKYGKLPNRLFALIGKNGVGKTRLLNQLSEALYDSSNPKNKNRFIINEKPQIPTYQKIIAISFSVFDHFFKGDLEDKSNETKKANYTYIGLHNVENSIYTSDEIVEKNISTFNKLKVMKRDKKFVDLINQSNILNEKVLLEEADKLFFNKHYSSGQKVFISMVCRFLSEIEDRSLIFLDEPELYLHPNAISSLMKMFSVILEDYQSYAILSTHSPLLVQEIPSRYVRNLSIVDDYVVQTEVAIETFGANLSDITKDIFNVTEHESLYKSTLIGLSVTMDEDEILDLFDDRLSLKARMFLSSLFIGKE